MTRVLLSAAFLSIASMVVAQAPPPIPAGKPSGVEAEVRSFVGQFATAWTKHDVPGMADLWTEDGDYGEPDGRMVFGRDEVKRLLGYEHASVFKESELHLEVETVRLAAADVAIVDGSYELFKARNPKGKPLPTRTGHFTSVLVKKSDGWKISATRLILPTVLIWREE